MKKLQSVVLLFSAVILILLSGCGSMNPFSGLQNDDYGSYRPMYAQENSEVLVPNKEASTTTIALKDEKVYRFTAQQGVLYVITLNSPISGLRLFLSDSTSNIPLSTTNGNSGEWTCKSTGTYFIRLKNNGSQAGTCSIAITYDNLEPDNTSATAVTVTTDGTVYNRLLTKGDHDWFKFSAKAHSYYIIKPSAQNCVSVLDSSDAHAQLASTNAYDGHSPELSFLCKRDGDYYLHLTNYDTTITRSSAYTLSIQAFANDVYEPDDSLSQAKSIATDGSIQSHRLFPKDVDWYKFEAEQGKPYIITGRNVHQMQLYATDGKKIILINSNENGADSTSIQWSCTMSGTYYFSVESTISASKYDYVVSVSQFLDDSYELDNTFQQAKTLVVNQPAQTHTLITGDEDWLKFSATAGNVYNVKSTKGNYIYLYSSNGTTLLASDGYSSTDTSRIMWTCLATNNYYLKVSLDSTTYTKSLPYQISINSMIPSNALPENIHQSATPILNDTTQSFNTSPGEQKWFSFSAIAGTSYLICVKGYPSISCILFSSDLTTGLSASYASNSIDINSISSLMNSWECSVSGTYYIKLVQQTKLSSNISLSILTYKKDAYEPDSTYELATLISTDGVVQSHVLTAADDHIDNFKFKGKAGTKYYIAISGNTTYSFPTSGENGTSITYDRNSRTLLCAGDDTFYFDVYQYPNRIPILNYTISITVAK